MDKAWREMETLKFVTGLMNHLSLIGAREEMRRMMIAKAEILTYIEFSPDKVKNDLESAAQLFLEYVYVGNRVGAGVAWEILDKETILEIWNPQ